MTYKFTNNAVFEVYEALNRGGDVPPLDCRLAQTNGVLEGCRRVAIQEGLIRFADGCKANGCGVVSDHTAIAHNYVKGDEIARSNGSLQATDAMNNFVEMQV